MILFVCMEERVYELHVYLCNRTLSTSKSRHVPVPVNLNNLKLKYIHVHVTNYKKICNDRYT